MKQRITVIFMCICLIITMLPTTVSAQTYTEGQLYWIWNGEGVKLENGILKLSQAAKADCVRAELFLELYRSIEGFFAVAKDENTYIPVGDINLSSTEWISAKPKGGYLYQIEAIDAPAEDLITTITANVGGTEYRLDCGTDLPHFGFFASADYSKDSFLGWKIDYSKIKDAGKIYYQALQRYYEDGEQSYYTSPEIVSMELGSYQNGSFEKEKELDLSTVKDCGAAERMHTWEVQLPKDYRGITVGNEGRFSCLQVKLRYQGMKPLVEHRYLLYDHMHQAGPANCKICSEDKLLWIWDDERMFVSKDADGLPVLKGVQELDNSSFYLEPDVGETRSGYFAYYDGELLRPVNVEISDGKTTVEKDADERSYLTRLTFAEAEYDIPVTYSNRGKNYSNMIKVCLPLAGFYTTARKDVKTFAPELSANKNNGVYYLVSDDFYKESGEQVLYFDEQLIPAYDASVGSKSATVKNIKITAMANNIWKFEITDAYAGGEDTNVLEGNSSWFGYRLELKSHDSDDVYENEICIYDKNSTVKNQLFYIDKRNVKTLGNGGVITPKHLYDVQKKLILEPNERKIGYFAYYNGKDFVAVEPSKLPQNFQATKLEDDEYLYAVEADNNSAAGQASWGQYSMDFKVELPWAGLYSAISGGSENYHGYQLLPTQQSSYYLICEGGTYDSYALKIEYDDLEKADLAVKGMEAKKIAENTNGKQVWKITVTKDFNGTYWDEEFGRYDNILFCISASKGISTDEYSFCTEIYEQKRPWIKGNLIGSNDAIDSADALYLRRAVANWPGYRVPKEIADLNADGKVDIGDINILERHIAGWKGYENLPVTANPLPVAEN